MDKVKLDVACAAFACAMANKVAVKRYESALSRQINNRNEFASGLKAANLHGNVKSHANPYVTYGYKQ